MDIILHQEQQGWRVLLKGSFTFNDTQGFRDLLNAITESPPEELIIDIAHVEYIDSSALGMLLLLKETTDRHQIHLMIAGASGQVLKVFAMSRFEEIFDLI